jgi:hypothetical protein
MGKTILRGSIAALATLGSGTAHADGLRGCWDTSGGVSVRRCPDQSREQLLLRETENMEKQAATTIEIETFAPSTSSALGEVRVSEDSGAHPLKTETSRRSALYRLIDSFALARCSMAGVYVGVWLNPPKDADSPAHRRPGEVSATAKRRKWAGDIS